jgi:hypothetical protein
LVFVNADSKEVRNKALVIAESEGLEVRLESAVVWKSRICRKERGCETGLA